MALDLITDSPDLATMIGQALDSKLVDVHTAMPGRVESYDKGKQVANIRPQLKRVLRRRDGSRVAEELPVLPCVPVRFPRVGAFFIHFPVKEGDFGSLIFHEYSIGRWRSIGDQVDPGDTRRHDLSGAEFVPGVFPSSLALPDGDLSDDQMRFGAAGAYVIEINNAGEIQMPAGASTKLTRDDRLQAELTTLLAAISGAGTTTGDGGAAFKAAILAALTTWPGATASDTVKGT
jgi:hypothetical protein